VRLKLASASSVHLVLRTNELEDRPSGDAPMTARFRSRWPELNSSSAPVSMPWTSGSAPLRSHGSCRGTVTAILAVVAIDGSGRRRVAATSAALRALRL